MSKYKVIIPVDLKPSPAQYELSAAALLANYFKTDVEFILRSNQKTPDFLIKGVSWELKTPTGSGRNNIERQLQTGLKQSRNIIFDARRSKIHISKIRSELRRQFNLTRSMERLILIKKNKTIVEITRENSYNRSIEGSAVLNYTGSEPYFEAKHGAVCS